MAKKEETGRAFARLVKGGKWHVAVEDSIARDWKTMFFPCRPWGWFGGLNEIPVKKLFGIFRGPFDGRIFTKTHKICGTCMRMKRNQKLLKKAGFIR